MKKLIENDFIFVVYLLTLIFFGIIITIYLFKLNSQFEQEKQAINTYEATINTCSDLNELESIKDKIVINALSTNNKELITSYAELMDLANEKITELEKTS